MNTNMLFAPLTLSPLLYNTIEDMKAKIRKRIIVVKLFWNIKTDLKYPKKITENTKRLLRTFRDDFHSADVICIECDSTYYRSVILTTMSLQSNTRFRCNETLH